MGRSFLNFLQLRVACCLVVLAGAGAILLAAPGPAFADSAIGGGAIGGSFFDAGPAFPVLGNAPGSPPISGGTVSLAGNPSGDLCGPAVASASLGHNLPAGILNAIATVESGRLDRLTGATRPWPWTIDANGTGYVYDTKQDAIQAALAFQAAGITSLDVGCLQVNLSQHPEAFSSLEEAFDPAANADFAARFLTSLYVKFSSWPQAVAAYHSQTPALGGPYATRVYAQWQGSGANLALASAGAAAPRAFAAAAAGVGLPQPDYTMSSFAPPTEIMLRSSKSFTGRTLASYRSSPVAIASRMVPPG